MDTDRQDHYQHNEVRVNNASPAITFNCVNSSEGQSENERKFNSVERKPEAVRVRQTTAPSKVPALLHYVFTSV